MSKVKCAVIGAGWWGTTAHIPALKSHPDADLVAVQRRSPEAAQKVATDFDIPASFTDPEELLAVDGLQAVVISSTPNQHYAQAKSALQRGLHVLLEKPMTMHVDEARELVSLADKRGVQFLISCPWHYTEHARLAQGLVRSGKLGKLKMIGVMYSNFTLGLYEGKPWSEVFGRSPTLQNSPNPYQTPGQYSYSDPATAGGGQIYCQVSHAAAFLSYLTGAHPTEVFARFDNGGTEVDVYDTLNIKYDDGVIASMASTGATMLSDRQHEIRLFGTSGMILMELWKGKLEFHDIDCNVTRYPDVAEEDIYPMFEPTNNLIDAITGRAPNISPASLGLAAMKITTGAIESVRTGQNILVG